jgi:class 3 adenylate cyclase
MAVVPGNHVIDIPEVHYARTSDGTSLAYQVLGDGPNDLLFVPGFATNLIWNWMYPGYARLLRGLASFSRLIVMDRRGAGLSDRFSPEDLPPLEVLTDDLRTVLDEVGSRQASVLGIEDGAFSCCMLAASSPQRVRSLIMDAMDPGGDIPGRTWTGATWDAFIERVSREWGTRELARWDLELTAPGSADDPAFFDWYLRLTQLGASPASAVAFLRIYQETDVQEVLKSVRIPTLFLHREGDRLNPISLTRYTASLVPDAKLVVLAGEDHLWMVGDVDALLDEIGEFLTGARPVHDIDRVLATVLFTDIVGSTESAAQLGDARWKELLDDHHGMVREELDRHGGREIDTAGDGFLATFDGPARAIRCAVAVERRVRELGIEVRAGVHTGEVELAENDVRGIAVHIGARVSALAGPSEVLVSSTVKDLVAGSGLKFEDRGEHELKGVPDRWHLYAVTS